MSSFRVPERDHSTLMGYLELSQEEKGQIIDCLAKAEVDASVRQISDAIHDSTGIPFDKISEIIRVVYTMMLVIDKQEDASAEDVVRRKFADKLAESLAEAQGEGQASEIAEELFKVLNANKNLVISAKSEELAFNRQKLIGETRILTDIRPVFIDSGSEDIQASILLYTLKLAYLENGREIEEYFALDKSDLGKLKAQIERAEKKSESITTKMAAANVKLIQY